MVTMVLPYFPFAYKTDFLSTKPDEVVDKPYYIVSFYLHITSSFLPLCIGLLQFIPKIILSFPKWHRYLGMTYAYSILLVACPTGLVIALDANGGAWAKVGFVLQCILWFTLTYLAVKKAVQKSWLSHIEYMLLSYAVTLAAFSLRTESFWANYFFPDTTINKYAIITWLSWVGNFGIGVLLIRLGIANYIYNRVFSKRLS